MLLTLLLIALALGFFTLMRLIDAKSARSDDFVEPRWIWIAIPVAILIAGPGIWLDASQGNDLGLIFVGIALVILYAAGARDARRLNKGGSIKDDGEDMPDRIRRDDD